MFRKNLWIKVISLILIVFFISSQVTYAETFIPAQTKLSVKIRENFADFQKGDYVKMYMNSKALKNKDVDWKSLNITEASTVFFTGYVSAVDTKTYNLSSGNTIIEYYANIDLDKMIVNDKAYKIKGKLYTKDGLKKENVWTNNYDIIFSSDVTDSDLLNIDVKQLAYKTKEATQKINIIVPTKYPPFFAGIKLNDDMSTVLEKISNIVDNDVIEVKNSIAYSKPYQTKYKKPLDNTQISNLITNSISTGVKSFYTQEALMPTGMSKFAVGNVDIVMGNIYIENVPLKVSMHFKANIPLYYTYPSKAFKLKDGRIMSYSLEYLTLYPVYNQKLGIRRYDATSVINLYEQKYPHDQSCPTLGTYVQGTSYKCYVGNESTALYYIEIETNPHNNNGLSQIFYSNNYDFAQYRKRYQEFLDNQIKEQYKSKPNGSKYI